MNLDGSKATPVGDIPADIVKQTNHIHLPIMNQIINMSVGNDCYLDDLKLAEVIPVFKKKLDLNKKNYTHVSVLSQMSKVFNYLQFQVFKRIMYVYVFMKDKLSNLLTGLRKNYSTQHCLMRFYEKWKKVFKEVIYMQYLWIFQRLLTHLTTIY